MKIKTYDPSGEELLLTEDMVSIEGPFSFLPKQSAEISIVAGNIVTVTAKYYVDSDLLPRVLNMLSGENTYSRLGVEEWSLEDVTFDGLNGGSYKCLTVTCPLARSKPSKPSIPMKAFIS